MWKALSLAIGITLMIVGAEMFFVDELEIKKFGNRGNDSAAGVAANPFQSASFASPAAAQSGTTLYQPADWMPWSLMAAGSIIAIYTFTLTSRSE